LVYLDRALEIHPVFGKASQSKGLCYFYLKDYKRAGDTWLQTQQMNVGIGENVDALLKSVADIYFYYGMKAGADKDFRKSISQFKQAIAYKPDMPEVWYNMGGAYFTVFNYDSAKLCFETALRYKPDMTDAQFGLNALIENGLVKPPVKKVE
jgi:tetratricopeptide (TPR) repeat protein